jgi:hypothetical protein
MYTAFVPDISFATFLAAATIAAMIRLLKGRSNDAVNV